MEVGRAAPTCASLSRGQRRKGGRPWSWRMAARHAGHVIPSEPSAVADMRGGCMDRKVACARPGGAAPPARSHEQVDTALAADHGPPSPRSRTPPTHCVKPSPNTPTAKMNRWVINAEAYGDAEKYKWAQTLRR